MKKVDIYTSETCSFCYAAKDYLKQHNVSYVEHNISSDAKARKELIGKGYRSVPLIIIDGEEVSGFNKERIAELLKL